MSTSGKYDPYSLCLSVTKLFLVLFKYFIVIVKKVEMSYENVIKKVEMLYVVLASLYY